MPGDRARGEQVRLDKWLWAARFFKTRSAATEAVDGGKAQVNGERAKPAKLIQVGDEIRLRQGVFEFHLTVTGLGERRGPASVAATLYRESAASRAARERLAEQMRSLEPAFAYERGRPTKRDRREIERLRRRR
ncbi:MAG: RNA-binding S4 domain-containing protein [Gemmatimonadota bacterium]